MLQKASDSSRGVPVCARGATKRLVLVLSTRARHVAGRYPIFVLHIGRPESARNARQPRIFLQMH
jgi:hypothetical protein